MRHYIYIGPIIAISSYLTAVGVAAQDMPADEVGAGSGAVAYLDPLKQCLSIAENGERLACYDEAVGRVVTAADEGNVTLVDRQDVKTTRRNLFGFRIPDLGILGGNSDEEEEEKLFESTITKVSFRERRAISITIKDGDAVWRMANPPRNMLRPKVGDTVVFKKASLGTYFIRINGRLGIKGKRVE